VTSGKTDRSDRWSWSGRAEYRGRDRSTRQGLLMSELRQPGEGQAVGGTFRGGTAREKAGNKTEATALALSWARRPHDSRFVLLEKLKVRSDVLPGAIKRLCGQLCERPGRGHLAIQKPISPFWLQCAWLIRQ
jgi:hypothetical protein